MTHKEMNVLAFTTAAPGWRLWIVDPEGKPKEVAFAGWVTLEISREFTLRETPQVICPGWFDHGAITTAMEYSSGQTRATFGRCRCQSLAGELRATALGTILNGWLVTINAGEPCGSRPNLATSSGIKSVPASTTTRLVRLGLRCGSKIGARS